MSQINVELNEAVARPQNEREREKNGEDEVKVRKPEYWREVNFPNAEAGEDYYEEVRSLMTPVDLPERDDSKVDFDEDGIMKVLASAIIPVELDEEHAGNASCSYDHLDFLSGQATGKNFYLSGTTFDRSDDSSDDDEEMTYAETREYEKAMKSGLVRYIVSPRFCKHQQRDYIKCACMCGLKFERDKYYFDEETLNDLLAICYELRLRQFTQREGFEAGEHYHKHFVTVISLTTMDKRLVCDPMISRDRFLTLVYELRGHYGMTHDFGQKSTLTGLDFEAQSIGDFVQRIIDAVKGAAGTAAKSVKDMVTKNF